MKKHGKASFFVICLIVILLGTIIIYEYVQKSVSVEEKIMESYLRVNILHYAPYNTGGGGHLDRQYRPFREITPERNEFGICVSTYLFLKFYERETENKVSYETLTDYFAQEFEPDGSLRLYNNGKHPEMQSLVEWRMELGSWEKFGEYLNNRILDIYSAYIRDHEDAGFIFQSWHALSPQMLDALARAEADPDYVLDLTGLQQAGY